MCDYSNKDPHMFNEGVCKSVKSIREDFKVLKIAGDEGDRVSLINFTWSLEDQLMESDYCKQNYEDAALCAEEYFEEILTPWFEKYVGKH